MIHLKPRLKIRGDGSSMYGKSDGEYLITKIKIEDDLLDVYGTNTEWFQYTDNKIEKELYKKLRTRIDKHTGKRLKSVRWSEQGMQPDNGWNFDLFFSKATK